MFLYCVPTGCSGHALWPAASATVGCLFLSMTCDLPWPLDVMHTVVYRPVEVRDFTRGRQVQVYCCLISYRRHCHVRSVAHVVVLTVCVYRIPALSRNILTSFYTSCCFSRCVARYVCLYFVLKHRFLTFLCKYTSLELTEISCMW